MAVSGAGDTAALLGLVNSLQTNQSEHNAVEEDRAFQMGMAQWQRAASEEMAANQAKINFALQTIAAKNVEESLEKTTQRDLGILSSKVSSPDALGAINSLLQVSATKASTIAEQRNRATETLAGLKGVEANLRQSIDTMRGQTAQYQAGANDFTLARLVQEKLVPGVATGNMDTRNWTMNIGEVSDTLAQVAAERPELVLPYRNAEGGVDMASLRSRGLMTAIETLNKEGLTKGVEMEQLQIDKAQVEAQREATRAAQEDPRLREYKRLTEAASKAGKTLPEYIAEQPEEKRAYYLTLGADTDEETVDAYAQLGANVDARLTADGVDVTSNEGKAKKRKLMRSEVDKNPKAFGEDSREAYRKKLEAVDTPESLRMTSGEQHKVWNEFTTGKDRLGIGGNWKEKKRLFNLVKDSRKGPDSKKAKSAAEKLDREYPEFDGLVQQKLDEQWKRDYTQDKTKAIDEALIEMGRRLDAKEAAKPKSKGWTSEDEAKLQRGMK
jgi:hypothetical protein